MKPFPIPGMCRHLPIDQEMNDSRRIDVPDLAPFVRRQQVAVVWKEPDATHSQKPGLKGGKTVAATILGAVASYDSPAAAI